jgi:hypothetical protein
VFTAAFPDDNIVFSEYVAIAFNIGLAREHPETIRILKRNTEE